MADTGPPTAAPGLPGALPLQPQAAGAPDGPYTLLVEDSPGDARLTRLLLEGGADAAAPLLWVQTAAAAVAALQRWPQCSAVLLDLGLPDCDGLDALRRLAALAPDCPIVLLTGDDSETAGLNAVAAGAQDFLLKGSFDAGMLRRCLRFAAHRKRIERALVADAAAAGQALQRSEQKFRLAAARGQVWDWDMLTGTVNISAAFWQLLGLPGPAAGQAATAAFEAALHPGDLGRWRAVLSSHLRRRAPYHLEYRARHADGHWLWFETQGQAVWDAAGRAIYMAGTTFEITARKQAELALMEARLELSQLAQALLQQEQRTTRRLAQTLHDQLGQTLAVARLRLDACITLHGAQLGPTAQAQVAQVSMLLDQAVREVRQVLVALRPPLLEDQGLAAALDNELRTRAGVQAGAGPAAAAGACDLLLEAADAVAGRRWPEEVELAAFMVAREAIANAQQHANATLVRVLLDGGPGWLALRVVDDGSGVPSALVRGRPGHLGVVGMRERATAIGARVTLGPASGGGTEVALLWPAQHPAASRP